MMTPQQAKEKGLISKKEAEHRFGFNRLTFLNWVKAGLISCTWGSYQGNKARYFDPAEIEVFIANKKRYHHS
jgi:hypothetical protein